MSHTVYNNFMWVEFYVLRAFLQILCTSSEYNRKIVVQCGNKWWVYVDKS